MSPLGLVLVIVLIIILFGGFLGTGGPGWGRAPWAYGYGLNHGGIGVIGIILIIVVVLLLLGRFPY